MHTDVPTEVVHLEFSDRLRIWYHWYEMENVNYSNTVYFNLDDRDGIQECASNRYEVLLTFKYPFRIMLFDMRKLKPAYLVEHEVLAA